jgi:hypothetical protein
MSETIQPVFKYPMFIAAARVRSIQPVAYRLVQKVDGTLVLQGAFYWTEGSNGGHDWEDIPTIIEAQEK